MKRVKTVLFMIFIAALYGAGVTGLYLGTQKTVEKNQLFLQKKTLVELFNLGDVKTLSKDEITNLVKTQIDQSENLTDPKTGQKIPLLKAYTDASRTNLKAYGFPFSGIGFWAKINGYIAVDAELKKTVGLKVISQSETPGLGARVEEEEFYGVFFSPGLNITTPAGGNDYLYMGTPGNPPGNGSPKYGRTFDAITGATQTSLAMKRMLNNAIEQFNRAITYRKAGD